MLPPVRLAYLFSRYPVVSQTFCDTEMLALERAGVDLEVFSIYPPHTSFRHGHAARLRAPIHYAPPQGILKLGEQEAKRTGRWPAELIAAHDRKYGPEYKAALRARNALYFADAFAARGITHFHVHFANRAAHTAVFIKAIGGIPFSVTAHGQDYMVDLGNHDLLREIARETAFFANETQWSTGELTKLCPDSAGKMVRVYNGMDLANFATTEPGTANEVPRIVSTGRLIEFKGFHHLIAACALLRDRGLAFICEIIGEGPWRLQLQQAIDAANLGDRVHLRGALPQQEIFANLRTADIFTLPCIVDRNGASDVFPTVILEAMASARPIVSTHIAGVPEQVVDGATGFICQPGDERGLADALEKLLRSPELRRQFGEAGQQRLRSEFGVDATVKPLIAQYEKHVRPTVPLAPREAGLAVLLHEWPTTERHEAELRQLADAMPAFRAWAFHAGGPPPDEWRRTLPHCDFLPDAMVVEGEWAQEKDLRHQIETMRNTLGSKLPTEDFLRHARYALSLCKSVKRDGIRHIHAAGTRELVTAWLLHRLCGVTISATIEDKPSLHADPLLIIARDCAALRAAADPFAEADDPRPKVTVQKSGRGFDAAWLARLRDLAKQR
jgi:glycosyltransferase involved in cell wall biosynthesis